ncbi:MAG: 3-hydroxybutyrate dehydrogenase [Pseudomonadota bacterium]
MLKGKSAIVTGSTSGIGLGIAHALAGQGINILFNGFGDAKEIDALVADTATKFGVKTAYSAADMSKPADIRAMVKQAEDTFGTLDVLVNNAGIQFTALVEDFPEDKWDAIIAINLSSAFHATKAALPGMKARNFGRIINIASAHGLVGSPMKSAYVAAKHGIIGLTKVVALEAGEKQITANAICPGWVLTPLVQKQIDDRATKEGKTSEAIAKEMLGEKQSNNRFTTPEQIGALAVFLCSDAAVNITGTTHSIDGGWTAE